MMGRGGGGGGGKGRGRGYAGRCVVLCGVFWCCLVFDIRGESRDSRLETRDCGNSRAGAWGVVNRDGLALESFQGNRGGGSVALGRDILGREQRPWLGRVRNPESSAAENAGRDLGHFCFATLQWYTAGVDCSEGFFLLFSRFSGLQARDVVARSALFLGAAPPFLRFPSLHSPPLSSTPLPLPLPLPLPPPTPAPLRSKLPKLPRWLAVGI
jgi:hypothetical protein